MNENLPPNNGPDPADVDALRGLLDLLDSFDGNDQCARYILSSDWMRDRGVAAAVRLRTDELRQAHAAVATAVTVTGRQVPHDLQQTAGELLSALWAASTAYGVAPEDWAATSARLPAVCVDVLAAVERRPRFEGGGDE